VAVEAFDDFGLQFTFLAAGGLDRANQGQTHTA
jgi:hypothetical protein